MVKVRRSVVSRRTVVLGFLLASTPITLAVAQITAERFVTAVAGNRDGSMLAVSVEDSRFGGEIVAVQTSTNRVLWTSKQAGTASSLTFSPDGNTVAVGYHTASEGENGLQIFDAKTGQVLAALNKSPDGTPLGIGFASWGEGVKQLFFAPHSQTLLGLSNDTLFAWDVKTHKFLWSEDVPDRLHEAADHSGPTGHVSALGLSEDGTRLAAARDHAVYSFKIGTGAPTLFEQRRVPADTFGKAKLAFSPDRQLLALGVLGGGGTRLRASTLILAPDGGAASIADCGSGIAWLADSQTIACQNSAGAHLRDVHHPTKDIGAAGPPSDLPVLKIGNSLWVAAYRYNDWKDPKNSTSLTLIGLGTGERVLVTLPGRP